ncbi:MAG: twin-arginine translocation signal domain-containing protein [Kiritimatiellae bacterium]|nr:twin-arginine translocation signal domain-containing protein [Kiritimatiellia bacterium]
MTTKTFRRGVSRRGFLRAAAAACLAGGARGRRRVKALDHACVGRMAAWAG